MCVNCLSNAEVVAAQVGLIGAVLKAPAHRMLADLGLVEPPEPRRRDARTVAFLRSLDLDPVAVLGAAAVAAADAWVAAEPQRLAARAASSVSPMRSQKRLSVA